MADDIPKYFSTASGAPIEPDVLAELESIARLHALSAEDMFYKWDSYCIRREVDATELTLAMVRAFKQDLQDTLEKSSRAAQALARGGGGGGGGGGGSAAARAGMRASGGGDVFGMLDGLVPSTPGPQKIQRAAPSSAARRRPFESPAAASSSRAKLEAPPSSMQDQLASLSTLPPSSFADRPAPGEVLKVLNEHLGPATPPTAPWSEPRIKLTANSDLKKLAYKGLAMKLSEASEVLDDRIDEFVTYVQDHHGLDAAAFGNPAAQATAPVVAVGRVASDALDGGARLNVASVVLETSRRSGAGLRVPLNLGKLRGFSIFPGQIIAVRGINTSGVEFIVDEILEVPLPPSAASAPSLLEQHRARVRSIRPGDAVDDDAMMLDDDSSSTPSPLSVFFAAGPYTADDNLDFEPLHELCARAAAEHVDAVVLAGPFLDADHPLVASGDFDLPPTAAASEDPDTSTLATLFRHAVAPPLAQLSHANPSATVILVPSVRDVLARHVSWPQDALCRRKDMRDLGLPPKMRLVTNPITLSLNEAMLAASSLDVLFELKAEELVAGRPAGGMDPLPRLARHVIEQRHYYPVFPPVDRSRLPKTGTADGIATGAMLDTGYLRLGELCGVKPDIMLLPSTMPPFAEIVESVLVVNPGTLSKRRGAGTYARLALHPLAPAAAPKDEDDPDAPVGHSVFDRARVEIVRI